MNLKKLESEQFDLTLLFGPMYHLFGDEDKLKALNEAKRVTKKNGVILVAYCMNEYGVITYAFKERHVLECMEEGRFTSDFKTISHEKELYDYIYPLFDNRSKPVLSTAASYYEIYGHAGVLRGIDNVLSVKWIKLWNWTLIMIISLFGGTFVSAIIPSIGTLLVLASSIIAVVVAVLKIKYTYDTVKIFKNFKV